MNTVSLSAFSHPARNDATPHSRALPRFDQKLPPDLFSRAQQTVDDVLAETRPFHQSGEPKWPAIRAEDSACLRARWVLAIGDSVTRLAFGNLVERLTGMPPLSLPGGHCMPTWRFLDQGVCNANAMHVPCVVDLRTPSGGRLTYVWAFGTGQYTNDNQAMLGDFSTWRRGRLAAAAVRELLRDARPREPDLMLASSGAWTAGLSMEQRSRTATAFLDALHELLPTSRCVFLGLPQLNAAQFNAALRPIASSRGCLFVNGSVPCLSLHAQGGLIPRHTLKLPGAHNKCAMRYNTTSSVCCNEVHCKGRQDPQQCHAHPATDPCFSASMCDGPHALGLPLAHQMDALLQGACQLALGTEGPVSPHSNWTALRDRLNGTLGIHPWLHQCHVSAPGPVIDRM